MATFGLPRHVVTFLRHMEPYKEFLKWDLCEGTHKITLRLSWNFRKHSGRESLWHKLQRTMKITQSQDSSIPQDLSRFLEGSPKKSNAVKSNFSRPLSWARISSISLPSRWRQNHTGATTSARNSLRGSPSMNSPYNTAHTSPSRLSLPVSPSRYSWPGTAVNASLPGNLSESAHGTPITSTPDSVRSDGSLYNSKIRISYRMEEDIAQSLENIAEKLHEQNKAELSMIQQEWNDAIRNWHRVLEEEDATNTSSERVTDSEPDVNLQQVNQTVRKCLQTCDSILDKHSTLIL